MLIYFMDSDVQISTCIVFIIYKFMRRFRFIESQDVLTKNYIFVYSSVYAK